MAKITDLDLNPKKRKRGFLDLISAHPTEKIKRTSIAPQDETTRDIFPPVKTQGNSVCPSEKKMLEDESPTKKDTEKGTKQGSLDSTKRVQAGINSSTHKVQSKYTKDTIRLQEEYKKEYEAKTEKKFSDISQNDIYTLTGIQARILDYIVEICSSKGTLHTPPLNIKIISDVLEEKKNSVKVAISRLKKKGIISLHDTKVGKFSCFKISEYVKFCAIEMKKINSLIKNGKGTSQGTMSGTIQAVDSSSYNNTNYNSALPESWNKIDFDPLKKLGFSGGHIIQIFRSFQKNPEIALPIEVIQESINCMAYDVMHNDIEKKINTSPVGMLTSMLKKGHPYSTVTPELYMTPKEEAIQKYLNAKKIREERNKKMELELQELEFNEWVEKINDEEKNQILGSEQDNISRMPEKTKHRIVKGYLSKFFIENVWPKLRGKILSNVGVE